MIRNCVAGDDPVMYHWAICWVEFRQHSHREHCDPVLVTHQVTGRGLEIDYRIEMVKAQIKAALGR